MASGRWIRVVHEGYSPSGKTGVWGVFESSKDVRLGWIKFHGGHSRYCFSPAQNANYLDCDILHQIAESCDQYTRDRTAKLRFERRERNLKRCWRCKGSGERQIKVAGVKTKTVCGECDGTGNAL